ncbi:unnamed protein product [Caenorhabditis auriculariae]|uniref:N-acetylgalactosaminide beta-1,3-galactosyltransferase n=1 Tax=Caenorhabditis auriculariae TaxID=2777116 RepID=A0A8S1HLH4_9PELO|nr:unnamed protein product [Caenorhabditis auriculariae]
MVQCGSLTALFKNDNYNIYSEDIELAQHIVWKKRRKTIYTIILGLLIVAVIVVIAASIRSDQKVATYRREDDPLLLPLIKVSPAAKRLPISGDLFCWVQSSTLYHDTRALAINETWLKRCDHGQIFTSEPFNDDRIPYSTVFAGIPDNYYNLFFKSRYAFYYIYKYVSQDFDWYLKADDDTYIIVEHLREYLSTLDPNEAHYVGYRLKPYMEFGYNAGGAGYVLSRAAVRTFHDALYPNETLCPDDIYEDVGISRCLASAGIFPTDTRNSKGQNRFNTFTPSDVFHQNKADESWLYYGEHGGYEAFANDVISFHKLSPDEIRLFDILLYRTDPPTLKHRNRKSNSTSSSR